MNSDLILGAMELAKGSHYVGPFLIEYGDKSGQWFIEGRVNGKPVSARIDSLREGLEIACNEDRAAAFRELERLSREALTQDDDQVVCFPDPIFQKEEYARRFG